MTTPDNTTCANTPREQALHWFAKARLATLTPAEQQALEAWLASDPQHAREYQSLQNVWQAADHLPLDEMRAIMERTSDRSPSPSRRRMLAGAGATLATVAAAGVLSRHLWAPSPTFTQRLASAKGQRRQLELPDGSHIDLNTDTEISIAFYETRRTVQLHRGEALFSVSPDTERPFSVDAGSAQVLVTGTQFNLRRDNERVMLAVNEGSVEFSGGPWWRRKHAHLAAGQVSAVTPNGLVAPYQDRVEAIMAWQQGRIVFRNTPLSDVAAELSRYLARPLRVTDPKVGRLRISGTLSIEAPEAALDILPDIAPVIVMWQAEGGAVLVAR